MPAPVLNFEVRFHGPVRVGRSRAAPGVDDTVDPEVIVPGSSLKGLMRAEAIVLLGGEPPLVDAVFGSAQQPSPWHWDDIRAGDGAADRVRAGARIRVDSAAGTAVEGGLFTAEYRWPRAAGFAVHRFLALPEDDQLRHETLLWGSALSVRSIGADRNRGFGWVEISRAAMPADAALVERVATLTGVRG